MLFAALANAFLQTTESLFLQEAMTREFTPPKKEKQPPGHRAAAISGKFFFSLTLQ